MTDIPAMMLWTDAYMGDTAHLTTTEHGAYMLILMAMWRNGGTLPDDDTRLARTARLTLDKWRRIEATIRAFMTSENGVLTQKRLKLELEIATGRREKLSAAGAIGGRAKALKNNRPYRGDAIGDSVAMNKQPEPEPEPEPEEEHHQPTAAAAPAAAAEPNDFEKKCRRIVDGEPCAAKGKFKPITDWLAKGCPESVILAALEAGVRKATKGKFESFASFDGWIKSEWERGAAATLPTRNRILTPTEMAAAQAHKAALVARGVLNG